MPILTRRSLLAVAATGLLAACDAIRFGGGGRITLAISPGNQTLWRYLEARNDQLLRTKGHLVDFVNVTSEDELRDGFVAGKFDAIATLVPAVAQLTDASVPAKFFLPIAWLREGYPLVVPESSPIKALPDIQGKRVATFPLEHPGFAYWRAFLLKHYGLRGEQVSTTQTFEPQESLVTARVDAAFLSGSGWAILQASGGFRKVADLQGEFKWLTGGDRLAIFAGFLAKSTWIDEHGAFIRDLIAACRRGLEQYGANKDAFLDVVTAEPTWTQLSRDENAAIATYLGYDAVAPDRVNLSREDVEDFGKFFPLMADAGMIKAPPQDPGALFRAP